MSQYNTTPNNSIPAKINSSIIGECVFGDEIGRGSFATVYIAKSTTSGRKVAVKSVIREKLNRKLAENLESEIKILRGIQHEHIVGLYDIVKTEKHIHLVMEYCSMGDLSAFIKRSGRIAGTEGITLPLSGPWGGLSELVVRHFLKQLASAVAFLRSRSLIHRDLKPQNLLLAPGTATLTSSDPLPILKLADFGFARTLQQSSMAATLCGSPLYMGPEILRGDRYDGKADLWSVGAILYEMITGGPPFKANNHVELLRRIERGDGILRFPGDERSSEEKLDLFLENHEIPQNGALVYADTSISSRNLNSNNSLRLGKFSSSSQAKNLSYDKLTLIPPVSEDLKDLAQRLLRKNPVERMSFEEFFLHRSVGIRLTESRSQETPKPPVRTREKSICLQDIDPYAIYDSQGPSFPSITEIRNLTNNVEPKSTPQENMNQVRSSGKEIANSASSISTIGSIELSGSDSNRALSQENVEGSYDLDANANEEYVVIDKGAVEVNWLAEEVEEVEAAVTSSSPRTSLKRMSGVISGPTGTLLTGSPKQSLKRLSGIFSGGSTTGASPPNSPVIRGMIAGKRMVAGLLGLRGTGTSQLSGTDSDINPFPVSIPFNQNEINMLNVDPSMNDNFSQFQTLNGCAERASALHRVADLHMDEARALIHNIHQQQPSQQNIDLTSAKYQLKQWKSALMYSDESLDLYLLTLSLYQVAIEVMKSIWNRNSIGKEFEFPEINEFSASPAIESASSIAMATVSVVVSPGIVNLWENEFLSPLNTQVIASGLKAPVRWIQGKFNKCLDCAEMARMWATDADREVVKLIKFIETLDFPNEDFSYVVDQTASSPGKIIHEKALEFSRNAESLVKKTSPNQDQFSAAENSYNQAIILLDALLAAPIADEQLNQSAATLYVGLSDKERGDIELLVAKFHGNLRTLKQRAEMM
ncbi:Serine/threonine-protein kinase, partial [Nowakowskiella sp. JEL0078]